MDRCAILVDAGYLFAQGGMCLTGSKKPRAMIALDASTAIRELKSLALAKAPNAELLRIYWYDGAIGGTRPTSDQALVAHMEDVKLRLGFINSAGQQKGVDSLIVTDLIELARLKSISDALLVSGDEDVRIGVQIAQNYGVRVHLVGIAPARTSQSVLLMQEADSTTEWDAGVVGRFLMQRNGDGGPSADVAPSAYSQHRQPSEVEFVATEIERAVDATLLRMTQADLEGLSAYRKTDRGIPPDLDRTLLQSCASAIGRPLNRSEIKHMRAYFQAEVQKRSK